MNNNDLPRHLQGAYFAIDRLMTEADELVAAEKYSPEMDTTSLRALTARASGISECHTIVERAYDNMKQSMSDEDWAGIMSLFETPA